MDNINLIESFSELKDVKNIDKETMSRVMQDVWVVQIFFLSRSYENPARLRPGADNKTDSCSWCILHFYFLYTHCTDAIFTAGQQ